MIATIGGAAAALLVLVVVVIALIGGDDARQTANNKKPGNDSGKSFLGALIPKLDEDSSNQRAAARDKKNKGDEEQGFQFGPPGASLGSLVIELNDRDRREVSIRIDGQMQPMPEYGPVEFKLDKGQHAVTLTRPGYQQFDQSFTLGASDIEVVRPLWQRSGGDVATNVRPNSTGLLSFDDWLQDFEAAQRKAQAENKDILIAFNGTDWCGWCIRLMHEVFFQPAFRAEVDREYVLVNIDLPRRGETLAKVHDRQRNEAMVERFGVTGFPTLLLADASGQVYARGGYVEGGVPSFMQALRVMQQEKSTRDRLFAQVESSRGQARIEAGEQALEWMRDTEVLSSYRSQLAAWLQTAERNDPNNAAGELETFFQMDFLAELSASDYTQLQMLHPLLTRLETFNNKHQFVDADRGARLNLIAASFLAMHEEFEQATQFVQAGLKCEPEDPEMVARLEGMSRAFANSDLIATGTGFVVAEGGYIVTNFHVVEEGVPYVRLADRDEPARARLLAKDEKHDIALLKLDDPQVNRLASLPVVVGDVRRGSPVAVFGYPMSSEFGNSLKLTTGGVSSLPDNASEGMLVLDCRVNPGNSGGPLCDRHGQVIGLITAKSYSGGGVDSYGMAQPAELVRQFLVDHVPGYTLPRGESPEELDWAEVDEKVSASVLMIVMKKK